MSILRKAFLIIIPAIIIGVFFISFLFQRFDVTKRQDLTQFLTIIQASLDEESIASLSGDYSDIESNTYQKVQKTLTRLSNSYPGVRYIYLMRRIDNKVIFLVDTKSNSNPVDESLAVPGEVYDDATDLFLSVFESRKNITIGPETDRWGTFISAVGPVFDSRGISNTIIGVDIDANDWQESKVLYIVPYILVLVLVLITIITTFLYYSRRLLHLQSQEHLANIVETSHDAIISLNLDGTIKSWNQGAQEIFGFTSQEAIGQKGEDLIYLPGQKNTFESVYSKIRTGQVIRNLQTDRQTKDKRPVTILISANPIYSGQLVTGISVVAKDITTDSKTKKSLEVRNQELEKLNELMIDREIKMAELKSKLNTLKIKK